MKYSKIEKKNTSRCAEVEKYGFFASNLFFRSIQKTVHQLRLSTEIMWLLTNFSVTSYLRLSSSIFNLVENLKFRTHADSITFIEIIDC